MIKVGSFNFGIEANEIFLAENSDGIKGRKMRVRNNFGGIFNDPDRMGLNKFGNDEFGSE